ncbi:MAG: single-stranded DNA-binding protein [Thermoflexibacter sp.]|nr:single-stranded DNA-binding protein [Thermoflexibacter sp.]
MRGLNRVTLIGNLGNDPDIKTLEGNIKVAKLSLALTKTSLAVSDMLPK